MGATEGVFKFRDKLSDIVFSDIFFRYIGKDGILIESNGVTVIMYHGVTGPNDIYYSPLFVSAFNFSAQIALICKHFDVISIDDALEYHKSKGKYFNRGKPKIVITFDDGYRNNLTNALPILEQHGVPATVYISTERVLGGQPYWWDRIAALVQCQDHITINLTPWGIGVYKFDKNFTSIQFSRSIERLFSHIKAIEPIKRKKIIEYILHGQIIETDYNKGFYRHLSSRDVKSLSQSSCITIGSHTHRHSRLVELNETDIINDILKCKLYLESMTGKSIDHFSYPNGEYDQRVIGILKKMKIKSAVTTKARRWRNTVSEYEIPRVAIGASDEAQKFERMLLSKESFFRFA